MNAKKQTAVKPVQTAVKPVQTAVVLTPEQKAAAKAAAAEKHYQTQLAALIAAGIPEETAKQALLALKPVRVAGAGNAKVTEIEEAILKAIISRAKAYNDAESKATAYTIEPVTHELVSTFETISAKIAEKVSYFKPNATKTGKTCLTADETAVKHIIAGYSSLIIDLYKQLPENVRSAAIVAGQKAGE
jgi:hypothetical protein